MKTLTPRTAPRAPGAFPLLGHAPALLRDPLRLLGSLASLGGVVELRVGSRPVQVVTDPELLHTLLVVLAHDCPRAAPPDPVRRALGEGLLLSEGRAHRDRRRVVQDAFTADALERYAPVVEEVARDRVRQWSDGRILDVGAEMNRLALEVVARVLFDARPSEGSAAAFHRALPHLMRGQLVQAFCPPLFARLPLPANLRFDAAVRVLDQIVDQAVNGECRDGSLLALLRGTTDRATGEPLTDDALRAEAVSLFTAGTEPIATTLTWLFHELMAHPRVHDRLLAELDSAPLVPRTVEDLPYLRNVLYEVLRLHTPNAFLTRTVSTEVQLGPYTLPAGSRILYSLTALHRDPSRYPDPLSFDPDRWHDTARHTFLPFGAGKHKCLGESFAWMELAVAAAAVLRSWRLLPLASSPVEEVVRTTVQVRGVTATAVPRRGL